MGQRNGLAYSDITKLNRLYKCGNAQANYNVNQNNNNFNQNNNNFNQNNNNFNPNNINNYNQNNNNNNEYRPFNNGISRIFDAYTSPEFWHRLLNSWVDPQRQRYLDQFGSYISNFFGY